MSSKPRTPRFMAEPADSWLPVMPEPLRDAGSKSTLFDSYIVVDWSARSKPGPMVPVKDSIWWAMAQRGDVCLPVTELECRYERTRQEAMESLKKLVACELKSGQRVLIGFDFPFGYPRGVATQLTHKASAMALWDWLAAHIEDQADNTNNRFEVASRINQAYPGEGPCWGRPAKWDFPDIPTKQSARTEPRSQPPEKRITDDWAQGAKSVWQLYGAGSVGSQTLLGLPALRQLIAHPGIAGKTAVWPFETGLKAPAPSPGQAVLVEVYPSLLKGKIDGIRQPGDILDRAQVRTNARALATLDVDGNLAPLFEGDPSLTPQERHLVETEEGWIFGLGHEQALRDSLT